jgi:two-component system, oxyanion-binding sensor
VAGLSQVQAAYRPDIYREVLGSLGHSVPSIDSRIEGFGSERLIDGRSFAPEDIPGYVAGFEIRNGISASVAE